MIWSYFALLGQTSALLGLHVMAYGLLTEKITSMRAAVACMYGKMHETFKKRIYRRVPATWNSHENVTDFFDFVSFFSLLGLEMTEII